MGSQEGSDSAVLNARPHPGPGEPVKRPKRRKRRRNRSRAPLTKEQQDLAVRYLPLARSLAKRFKVAWSCEADEFESAACLALVEAAQSYDATRGVSFATYARKRILGELRDVQRKGVLAGWYSNIEDAPDLLLMVPDAEECGRVLLAEPDPPVHEDLDSKDHVENLMQRLPGKHASACREIYLRGRNQSQTGVALGISQARVCVLHKQSMEMLGDSLSSHGPAEDKAEPQTPQSQSGPGAPTDPDIP
jgi:RNA polymerase sigma factor (sigma-70 family)